MAFLDFKNVRIAGIAAGVPQHIEENVGDNIQSNDYDAAAYVELTGVKEKVKAKEINFNSQEFKKFENSFLV